MSESVKWIKMIVGAFDGSSFKKIKRATIDGASYRDKLTAVWFELLDLAGKTNHDGLLVDRNEIPYESFEDIAIMLDRDEKEIELCMEFYLKEQMIKIVNKTYCITKFVEYQSADEHERIKEQRNQRQKRWRERVKLGEATIVEDDETSTKRLHSVYIASTPPSTKRLQNVYNSVEKDKELNKEKSTKKEIKLETEKEVSKYVSKEKKEINNKQVCERACACESYDEIFSDFGVSQVVKEALIEFIKFSKAKNVPILNDRLKTIIVRLDTASPNKTDIEKVQMIKTAIASGFTRLPIE